MPMPAAMAAWLSGISVFLPAMMISPAVGLVKAVEDRHQRRFARAVLADDAVDRAGHHADRDVLVGLHGAEGLGNALEFNGRGDRSRPAVWLSRCAHQKSSAGQVSVA